MVIITYTVVEDGRSKFSTINVSAVSDEIVDTNQTVAEGQKWKERDEQERKVEKRS